MAYQLTITLNDDEYARLTEEAAKTGQAAESIAHALIARHVQSGELPKRTMTSRVFLEQQ